MSSGPIAPVRTSRPNRGDVERQLDKMLNHPVFVLRPQPAKVFALLVNATLDGIETTEKYLREMVFPTPPYELDSAIARRTVDIVRELIDEYYAFEAKDDLVIVSLPKSVKGKRIKFAAGDAYKPSFSYNPRHEAMKLFRLGSFYSRRGGPTDLILAREHFTKALEIHPDYADAVLDSIWGILGPAWSSTGELKRELLDDAESCSNAALKRFPGYWKSHFMCASVLATKGDLVEARNAYEKALSLDPKSTLACVRRTPLLRQLGDTRAQLKLSQLYLDEHLNDPDAYVTHAAVLQTMERFDDAILSAQEALRLDGNYLPAHFVLAGCLLFEKRHEEAESHIERMKILADEATFAKISSLLQDVKARLYG